VGRIRARAERTVLRTLRSTAYTVSLTVHDWTTGKSSPNPDHLRKIAEVLPVTLDELLGVAAGQDPPFAAWAAFLQTAEGAALTPDERRTLQAIPWPPGREPTTASYQIALASLRTTTARQT
jgi:transcriptional regulator with XRE-family HTH domain